MNTKSKLFSLLVLGLLLIPVLFIAPQSNSGQVLGESEVLEGSSSSSVPAEIGSGVREVREPNQTSSSSEANKRISGTVIWDENQTVDISTNKFGLGRSVKIKTPSGEFNGVINAIRPELAEETLMVVNKEMFIRLGGNPEKDPSVTATMWLDSEF